MKISDILNLNSEQLSNMNPEQLKRISQSMVSASNKRIKRIMQAGLGYASFSVSQRRYKSGKIKKFTSVLPKGYIKKYKEHLRKIRPDAISQMKPETLERRAKEFFYKSYIASMKLFLTSPSSTLEGARKSAERIAQDLGATSYDELSRAQQNKFWKAYNELKRKYPDLLRSDTSRYMGRRAELFDFMVKKTKTGKYRVANIDRSVDSFFASLDRDYQQQQRTLNNEQNSPLSLPSESGEDSLQPDDEGDLIHWN